ncbi:hypothetical protein NC652_037251 [Populus alba x Populus x berolinensis]|nr:hypothetical protein NC652_037251 [Populus alba x Populus x berolinensis]
MKSHFGDDSKMERPELSSKYGLHCYPWRKLVYLRKSFEGLHLLTSFLLLLLLSETVVVLFLKEVDHASDLVLIDDYRADSNGVISISSSNNCNEARTPSEKSLNVSQNSIARL